MLPSPPFGAALFLGFSPPWAVEEQTASPGVTTTSPILTAACCEKAAKKVGNEEDHQHHGKQSSPMSSENTSASTTPEAPSLAASSPVPSSSSASSDDFFLSPVEPSVSPQEDDEDDLQQPNAKKEESAGGRSRSASEDSLETEESEEESFLASVGAWTNQPILIEKKTQKKIQNRKLPRKVRRQQAPPPEEKEPSKRKTGDDEDHDPYSGSRHLDLAGRLLLFASSAMALKRGDVGQEGFFSSPAAVLEAVDNMVSSREEEGAAAAAQLVAKAIRLLVKCRYPWEDIEAIAALASAYLERLINTSLKSMELLEMANVLTLSLYMAHTYAEDEHCPLIHWHRNLFRRYCDLSTLKSAMIAVFRKLDFKLRVDEPELERRIAVLRGSPRPCSSCY